MKLKGDEAIYPCRVDDLSWLPVDDSANAGWAPVEALPSGTKKLLTEIGRTYAPFMVANAAALQAGAEEMSCRIDDATYRQAPFGYQGKCLGWLRDEYRALTDRDRDRVDAVLADTGCEILFD